MSTKERDENLLEYLRLHGEATVGELSEALFVSQPTLRRMLSRLAGEGRLIRTYGGAAMRGTMGENLPQEVREREHSAAKAVIGRRALELVKDGDTVMVDGSSTAMALLSLLSVRKSVAVVTNSAKAPLLLGDSGVRLFVTGGELAPHTYAYVGSYAEDFLRSFHADVCFFSVRTLTTAGALTDNAIAENAVRRVMLANSRRAVLMLGSQKIGEPCLNTLCHLDAITHVVSERDISPLFPTYREKFI